MRKVDEMHQVVEAVWGMFDTDASNTISSAEFLERDGLADTIVATVRHM